jgi:L-2-hydroxycarboxylate dehydrogenase (NAD+)
MVYDVSGLQELKDDPIQDISVTQLRHLCLLAALKYGYDLHKAQMIVDVLLYAHLRDNSQGLLKLVTNAIPSSNPSHAIKVVHETPLSVRIDCQQEFGMVAMSQALDIVISKAKKTGFGLAALFNSSSSTGAIGYYVKKLADNGLVGFALSQSFELVAPHGSYEPIFGTNPIAIGVPTNDSSNPIVLDMATSVTALFSVYEALRTGKKLPDDIAFDVDGKSTSDPKEAIKGALKVFDRSYKGSHLAFLIEVLGGAMVGGAVFDKKASNNWGNLMFAFDLSLIGDDKSKTLQNITVRVQLFCILNLIL